MWICCDDMAIRHIKTEEMVSLATGAYLCMYVQEGEYRQYVGVYCWQLLLHHTCNKSFAAHTATLLKLRQPFHREWESVRRPAPPVWCLPHTPCADVRDGFCEEGHKTMVVLPKTAIFSAVSRHLVVTVRKIRDISRVDQADKINFLAVRCRAHRWCERLVRRFNSDNESDVADGRLSVFIVTVTFMAKWYLCLLRKVVYWI